MKNRALMALAFALLAVGGCSLRLGGPGPVEYRTIALSAATGTDPEEIAEYIRQARANVVLLSAPADSAWFAEIASRSKLTLSGPGAAGGASLAFLASAPLGDTTLTLPLDTGGEIVLHDALYRVDKDRYLDLLAVRIGPGLDTRAAVRALLRYIATDVMTAAAVVLAIEVPDAGTGDALAELIQPAFLDARRCLEDGERGQSAEGPGMRLFYGPEARLRCGSARHLGVGGAPLVARLIIDR